jgi:hypothetical protein
VKPDLAPQSIKAGLDGIPHVA